MTNEGQATTREAAAPAVDPHGRDRMLRNVVTGWAGYLAMAVTGFVAPRLMDQRLGQEALGVWDFGWSIVSYFALAQLGVGASVNRYVARYRAAGDVTALRRMLASVSLINAAAAGLVLLLSAGAALWVPRLLRASPAAGDAGLLVLLLGATVASELGFGAFVGVISGCHRFDLQNGITAVFEIATSLAMIAALYAGGGLIALGCICLGFELATEAARVACAYRVCPELRLRFGNATLAEVRTLLGFGGKQFIAMISHLLLVQGNRLVVGTHLGPALLAVYSRPQALTRVVEALVNRFAFVLTPTASSLEGAGRLDDVRELLVQSTRYGTALMLPPILGLIALGDPLLVAWMGPRYQPGLFMILLMLGFAVPLAMRPASTILLGLNLHGAIAKASLASAAAGLILSYLAVVHLGAGLVGAALGLAGAMFCNGLFVAQHACRRLGIPRLAFLKSATLMPLACNLPFAAILLAARLLLGHRPWLAVLTGSGLGAIALAPLYWRYLLPRDLQAQVVRVLGRWRRGRDPGGP